MLGPHLTPISGLTVIIVISTNKKQWLPFATGINEFISVVHFQVLYSLTIANDGGYYSYDVALLF